MELVSKDRNRYNKHLILPNFGEKAQTKLLNSKVLIVGLGGLGSPAALYLAAAGVGTLGLADYDQVELSNLQRQIIHSAKSIGLPKTASAEKAIKHLNPNVIKELHSKKLTSENIKQIARNYDFIIDATDNYSSKFLINDTCVKLGIPFSHAGVLAFKGQTTTILPRKTACYRCTFPKPPNTNAEKKDKNSGILGPIPGVIGCIQAIEAIKFITHTGDLLINQLLSFDALTSSFRTITTRKKDNCPACSLQ